MHTFKKKKKDISDNFTDTCVASSRYTPEKAVFFALVSCDIDNVRCVGGVLACGFRGDIIAERLEETVNENGQNIANVRKIIPLLLRACYQQEGMDFWKVIKFECLRSATKY